MRYILFSFVFLLSTFSYGKTVVVNSVSHNDIAAKAILIFHSNLAKIQNLTATVDTDTDTDKVKIGETCPHCNGSGKQTTDGVVKLDCVWCNGDGVVDKGDDAANEDTDEDSVEPVINRKRVLPGPLQKPSNLQDMYVDTYEFTMGGRTYYYSNEPNEFICPSTGQVVKMNENWYRTPNYTFKKCHGSWCEYVTVKKSKVNKSLLFPEATYSENNIDGIFEDTEYSSPVSIIDRALKELSPKPNETFLDVGSGDGRAVIMAAAKYGCKGIGIESDPERIQEAEENAEKAGVADKVEFIEGDFNTMEWPKADVGYVYLFENNLVDIRNKLLKLDRFASYAHKIPNIKTQKTALQTPMWSYEDFYIWDSNRVRAIWDGKAYAARPQQGCNCVMCQSVVGALNEQKSHQNK